MKGKDPAFLFYSAEFYEGTRTMLPEERACLVDLMIYQHQRGYIPKDLKRVLLYCNGINEATLKATLEAKFKQTEQGWLNETLQRVIEDRENYSEKQSINGAVGQFWKKSKSILMKKDYDNLKIALSTKNNNEILDLIKNKEINKATLKAMLEALLKQYRDRDINKDLIELKEDIYPFEEFWNDYDKKVGEKEKIKKKYEKLKDEEKEKIRAFIPRYKQSQPEKQYRKNPETFLNNKSWNDEIITTSRTEPNNSRAGYKQQDKWG